MSYLNSITLVGFVGSDPEQRQAKGNNMANEEFARDQYRAGARLAGHPAAGMPSVPKALCGYRMEEQPFQVPSVWRGTPPH